MYLQKLSLVDFKNYEETELQFDAGLNCIVGNNGEGKTNLLDAIYYLSFCKSFLNPIDSQNIQHGKSLFMVQGEYLLDAKTEVIYCGMKKNQKKQFKHNKKEYPRLADHIGLFPLVIISPADGLLISEGSDIRRKCIDGVISQYDSTYLDDLLYYTKVVNQRNALLKLFAERQSFDSTGLQVWNEQMITLGNSIFQKRNQFLKEFIDIFQQYYKKVTKGKEKVEMKYQSQLIDGEFSDLLAKAESRDRKVLYSTVGVHKDDLIFQIENHPIKRFGSQGQQKSYLIALKLAQFEFIKEIKKVTPILLLDDIFDKLDDARVQALMELVSDGNFGQIFLTDTNEEHISDILKKINQPFQLFTVKGGSVKQHS